MPNSIDFYKGIFLHVIPVRIIVPCYSTFIRVQYCQEEDHCYFLLLSTSVFLQLIVVLLPDLDTAKSEVQLSHNIWSVNPGKITTKNITCPSTRKNFKACANNAQKMKFSIRNLFSKYYLGTFTEEIFNGKLHVLRTVTKK